jgi:hypothetical protein
MTRADRATRWMRMALLLLPSVPLAAFLAVEVRYGGARHFFLHTFVGWNMGLLGLLTASYLGKPWSRWDGVTLLALALWAQMPDFIYITGVYHVDWMDIFWFHIALDEIILIAMPALGALLAVLLVCYARFRAGPILE